jgi:hypothetical protein
MVIGGAVMLTGAAVSVLPPGNMTIGSEADGYGNGVSQIGGNVTWSSGTPTAAEGSRITIMSGVTITVGNWAVDTSSIIFNMGQAGPHLERGIPDQLA